jgi:hypothetical protein
LMGLNYIYIYTYVEMMGIEMVWWGGRQSSHGGTITITILIIRGFATTTKVVGGYWRMRMLIVEAEDQTPCT